MHRNLDKLKASVGFEQNPFYTDTSITNTGVFDLFKKGMSAYIYIGHGSGTKWNCPQKSGGMSISDVNNKLQNKGMYPFILDCSCLNGGFAKQNPCFAQAMIQAKDAGALSMYSSAPTATGTTPKDLQSGAVDMMANKINTVGGVYYVGMMQAYKLKPSAALYTLESYNMFADPSVVLAYLK